MTHTAKRIVRGILALGLCAPAAACGATSGGNVVTILVPWEKNRTEYLNFENVISQFDTDNGIQVNIESTRALTQDLDADIAARHPPDLADLSSPAALAQYTQPGKGLQPLSIQLDSYYRPWRDLARLGTDKVYAVPVKADVTSLIWYRKNGAPAQLPTSLTALEAMPARDTWCLGLAAGTASGWPGTDWIANILLSQQGASTYEQWLTGAVLWTSKEVTDAWNEWGTLMRAGAAISGGAANALKTGSGDAVRDSHCEFERGALAATTVPTSEFNYVQFPSATAQNAPLMVAGDFMGQFTNNPNATKLLTYLASEKAQKAWVNPGRPELNGYAFSADNKLKPTDYPAGPQQEIAALLRSAAHSDATLCFDTDDMLAPDMSTAFRQAVLDYVAYFDASRLTTLLKELQQAQDHSRQGYMASVSKAACTINADTNAGVNP